MKRSLSLILTIAALGVAGSAYAIGADDQASQPDPGAQPSTAATTQEPASPQTEPSSPARSSASSALQNTRLAAIVPAGMSAQEACAGFHSTDECAATLHASKNLGLSFSELKSKVTGGQKLGAAIKALKPGVDVKAEVRKAEEQARADVSSPSG